VRVDDTGAYANATPQAPGNWSTWTITRNITAIGSHTLRARVTDNAGNVSWNPGTHTINIV
ncbi:MAG: Ig-like domain-containing protein, partial [Nitrososphaeraceae archaeon]